MRELPLVIDAGRMEALLERLRQRERPRKGGGWGGVDLELHDAVCAHWSGESGYGAEHFLERLRFGRSLTYDGLHLIESDPAGAARGLPVLAMHGWASAPFEFDWLAEQLAAAGHPLVAPSLPGYGFSEPLAGTGAIVRTGTRIAAAMEALGHRRYLVVAGDWGSVIGSWLAAEHPDAVAGLYVTTPGALPLPGSLEDRELDADEVAYARVAQRWRSQDGWHLALHGRAPDALGIALEDSPAGFAAYLLGKLEAWSDAGALESFGLDGICDLLGFYWLTGTVRSSLGLYALEAADRWRLGPGQRVDVPSAAARMPGEILDPPRAWVERVLGDLRIWTEFERGGHFAAAECPGPLAVDLLAFASQIRD